jgi:hypothetical protein
MDGAGGDLSQGNEDEPAFGQARMRDLQAGGPDVSLSGQEKVDVDRPGAVPPARFPAHSGLDGFRRLQQLLRRKPRFDLQRLV